MKFLVDMPLPPGLARWLTQWGHDAVHCLDIGFGRASDLEIMARAADEGRVIITADLDFPRLLALSRASEPALIVFRGDDRTEPELIARTGHILATVSEAAVLGHITVIDKNGVRHRRLPIA